MPASSSSHRLTKDQDRNLSLARTIELDEQDALPASELQASVGVVQRRRGPEQQCLAMRMTVRALTRQQGADVGVVVAIGRMPWRRPRQQLFEVHEQQRLWFVDDDRGGGVERLDVHHAGPNAGGGGELFYLDRQIDEL